MSLILEEEQEQEQGCIVLAELCYLLGIEVDEELLDTDFEEQQ